MEQTVQELFHLLENGTSAVMVVKEAEEQLKEAGFEEMKFYQAWGLTEGGKYYMKHHDTTLFAFTIGEKRSYRESIRIGAAHTDFPCLRIKPNPDIVTEGYAQINVEVYGGAILNTWLDRPLSISGRVALQSEDVLHPKMRQIDLCRPLMAIPNLAIHMNREVNKGIELNKQTDMLPILGLLEGELEKDHMLLHFLAKELQVEPEDILDFELWVYCTEKPQYFGLQEEFILSPRLDNLTSVQALLTGLINSSCKEGLNLIALFDHEEIGSRTKQGAGSLLLLNLIEKIGESLGKTSAQIRENLYQALFLSVDVAHGLHPNQSKKMDLTNKPVLGKGLCIKEASAQSYATDCEAVAIVEQICRKEKIPYQKFVNRSDLPGGGTLGAIASAILPVRTVDIGVPLLAMHSAVETMGAADMKSLTDLITAYFQV
ncbi:MAG: M18 family aminopeptidase [Lachnospiraceae bacterium]|nr:M18 family aminopeptidase [Lachnospiraceae bacterium]